MAWVIDFTIVFIVWAIVSLPFAIFVIPKMETPSGEIEDTANVIILSTIFFGQIIVSWLYYAFLEASRWQGTIGKKALGLKVTDMESGKIGFGRATARHFSKILSRMIFGIGYIMAAFTEKKQGLHDIIARTLVVKA